MTLVVDLTDGAVPLSRREFADPIASMVGEGARVARYDEVDAATVDAEGGAILCGTALRDNGFMDHLDRFEWLRGAEAPVLGICAGMQVLGALHGARLVRRKEIGMTRIDIVAPNPILAGPQEVYELHSNALEGLEAFEVLAVSEACVQAIRLRDRPHYGIMFHPEVRRGDVVGRFLGLRP